MQLILALALASVIGFLHFFGEEIDERISTDNLLLASFSAGLTIAYFFLSMLPKISAASHVIEYEFLYALAGFSMFYVVEEFIYERDSHLSEIKKDFKELHSVFIFGYHFAIGLVLYFLLGEAVNEALLFFFPVMIHTAVNSLAIKEMHEEMLDKISVKLVASFSAVLGVAVAHFFQLSQTFSYSVFGVIGGMFLYVVVHDALSPESERPLGFILGAAVFVLIVSIV